MRIQIVKDDVDVFSRILANDVIHKVQELAPSAPGVVPGSHLPGGNVECCKQRGRAVPLLAMAEPVTALPSGRRR
jgi:hypothetical protein